MIKIKDIFKELGVSSTHPKVLALQEVEKLQENIEEIPRMEVNIELPVQVMTDKSTIKRQGVKIDGCKFIIIDLMTAPTSFTSKEEESLVCFDSD
jgi:hypothetical protein